MSKDLEGALEADERQSGEVFMLSFGAVGALALLDAEPAAASLAVDARPLTPEEAQALLLGAPPAPPASDLATPAPAAADAAFIAALAALGAPSAAEPWTYAPSLPGTADSLALPAPAPGYSADASGDDAVGSSTPPVAYGAAGTVYGDHLVVAMAPGATLTISGQNDLVLASANDVIHVLSGSSVTVRGGGAKVNLASQDALSLTGAGYKVHAVGANDVVTVQADSQATIYGNGVQTQLAAPTATATVVGDGDTVNAAGSSVTVGNASAPTGDLSGANSVYINSGAVNLMDRSTLAAHGTGAAYLGANDYIALFGTFDIYAPQATGASTIAAFGFGDTLYVQSTTYSDIAALLNGVTESNDAATLHLTTQDSLTLTGVDKSQLSSLASSGAIRLH